MGILTGNKNSYTNVLVSIGKFSVRCAADITFFFAQFLFGDL